MALTAKLVSKSVVPEAPRTGRKATRSIKKAAVIATARPAITARGNGRPQISAKHTA